MDEIDHELRQYDEPRGPFVGHCVECGRPTEEWEAGTCGPCYAEAMAEQAANEAAAEEMYRELEFSRGLFDPPGDDEIPF